MCGRFYHKINISCVSYTPKGGNLIIFVTYNVAAKYKGETLSIFVTYNEEDVPKGKYIVKTCQPMWQLRPKGGIP